MNLNTAGGRISEIERSIITRNMNSRIRERGLTSKEMAFNRDQGSNEVKPSNDNMMAKEQLRKRLERHPNIEEVDLKCKVGDNVFLKLDISKQLGRELYKVIRLFQKDSEKWAVIQKCEHKFMSKEYEVKLSEIFIAIPSKHHDGCANNSEGDSDTDAIDKETEDVSNISENDSATPAIDKESEDPNSESENQAVEKEPKEVIISNERRPQRLSALKQRVKMKDLLSCLRTESKSKPKLWAHGWSYDDWIRDIENDADYEILAHEPVPEDLMVATPDSPTNTPSDCSDNLSEDEEEP